VELAQHLKMGGDPKSVIIATTMEEPTELLMSSNSVGTGQFSSPPSEGELVLLCLDYLRDLRRVYPPHVLRSVEGIDSDYLTMACWALNRAFVSPPHLQNDNDAYFDRYKAGVVQHEHHPESGILPSLATMEKELLYSENPHNEQEDQKKEEEDSVASPLYEYDDAHTSNVYRFYPLGGLASGPALKGSLSLGEITAAGLAGLGARSRLDAEKEMISSPPFGQFFQAVQAKGFFEEPSPQDGSSAGGADEEERKQQLYEERYRKVVAKFRTKLGSKAEADSTGELVAQSAAEQQRQKRKLRIQQALNDCDSEETKTESSSMADSEGHPASFVARNKFFAKIMYGAETDKDSVVSSSVAHNPVDLEEAEKLKSQGNSHMQCKEYQEAANCYTQALKLSPAGPNSHVYFSNRAAAMVSMKKFNQAILDSERSLALQPGYGKAHARLGLAHLLLGNYRQAMEAYTVALKYDPDNKSSKNYLEKAAKKLAASDEPHQSSAHATFSVVSEWEKSTDQRHYSGDEKQVIVEEREAEKYKVKGNCSMANREYTQALEAYTKAIQLCPNGSNSHVYYSNRAASLCYLERYSEAEKDSLKALSLNPKYGKAHARLGLSRFFLQDYQGAVSAYTASLEHDPDNAASKSYLAKAEAKLEAVADARRLMESSDFRRAAEKALSSPDKESLDPSIMAGFSRN
jgi:tetratricopeptide (TPR) repeat protein